MTWQKDSDYFRQAIRLAEQALAQGNDGFACLLVDAEGDIVMEQGNAVADLGDPTAHDALTLISRACRRYDRAYLSRCTLYATMEPCVMCTAAAYWAGLGAIKFAVAEQELNEMLGNGIALHSRDFARLAQWDAAISGPYPKLHGEAINTIAAWVRRITGREAL